MTDNHAPETRNGVLTELEVLMHPVVMLVTLFRLLAALYILIEPFWGLLWTYVLDVVDARVLLHGIGLSRRQYHDWDKNVDWFAYIAELWVGAQYGVFLPLFMLLFYRFLGQFMFLRYKKTWMFIIFPNFFEVAYMWLVLFHPDRTALTLGSNEPWFWLYVFFLGKMVQEVWLHYVWTVIMLPGMAKATRDKS